MIGLLTKPGSYAIDCLTVCSKTPLASVDLSGLGLPDYRCPYDLPVIRSGDHLIIVSGWLFGLRQQGIDVVDRVLAPLRERFSVIIGFDQADPFQLDFPNEVIEMMDVVLKVNGVYKDADLYNYVVGAPTPDGRWTEKAEPREANYAAINLNKLRLSIPCFLGVSPGMRALTRRIYAKSMPVRAARALGDRLLDRVSRPGVLDRAPKHTVHFFASLSHIQRLTAARLLKRSSLRWRGGITSVPPFVTGLRGVGMTRLTDSQRQTLAAEISAEGLVTRPRNRFSYQLGMSDCKAVLSVTGYGELCFRMAEAWANRRVLVCQDISHVRTLFPFQPGMNVVYCRPDLSDLEDILDDIECNYQNYVDIAERGHRDWRKWSHDLNRIMREGFAPLYDDTDRSAANQTLNSTVVLGT
jgi:hypothetical protein